MGTRRSQLGSKAGIIVPDASPLRFPESRYTTFLVKRFDRTGTGGRLQPRRTLSIASITDFHAKKRVAVTLEGAGRLVCYP